jgi:hypothetical protein
MRLQFNKLGYEMYEKEQSRRVPAVRAKPGNPGYGFRRARWRETAVAGEDRKICEAIFKGLGVSQERIDRIRQRVNDFKVEWDIVRRPSRPAGPGRPRGQKRATGEFDPSTPTASSTASAASLAMPAIFVPAQQQTAHPVKKAKKASTPRAAGNKSSSAVGGGKGQAVDLSCSPSLAYMGHHGGGDCGAGDQDYGMGVVDGPWEVSPQAECGRLMTPRFASMSSVGGGVCGEEDVANEEAMIVEENQSLRSLNMSLIYEREQLLSQIKSAEKDLEEVQVDFDSIGHESPGGPDGPVFQAFSSMARRLTMKEDEMLGADGAAAGAGAGAGAGGGAGDGGFELSASAQKLLLSAFDRYDTSLSAEAGGSSNVGRAVNSHHHNHNNNHHRGGGGHDDVFEGDLYPREPRMAPATTCDLRDLLGMLAGGGVSGDEDAALLGEIKDEKMMQAANRQGGGVGGAAAAARRSFRVKAEGNPPDLQGGNASSSSSSSSSSESRMAGDLQGMGALLEDTSICNLGSYDYMFNTAGTATAF